MKRSPHKLSMLLLCGVLLPLILTFSAQAESDSGDKWEFHLAPYVWLAGQKGEVATIQGLPPVDIDVDFYDDILGNINGALFLVGEARKDRYGMFLDIAYTDIEDDNATPGPFFSFIKYRTEAWIVSATGLYRLVQKPRGFLDLLAGVRYWSVESTLSMGAGLLPAQEVSHKEDWVDPIIGFKFLSPLWESKFFVGGGLVIGGFRVGSDFMGDANINLGYQWAKWFSTTVGYRYLVVDYENDGFLYDIAQSGLTLALSFRF